jgi:putative CocE/NonD family hydrolase
MSIAGQSKGVVASRAERPVPDMRVDFDVEIPMRDGTILRCDIYRPAGLERVPVILQRTPYDKRFNHTTHTGLDARAAVARGYALVVQDVRGRFASEGKFFLTPTRAVEGPDGFDTIEWLAGQSWCTGAIGMVGHSYGSLTQLLAASERPPHLRAIIPEKTGFPARGGFMLDSIMVAWTAGQAMDWVQKAMLRQEAGQEELDIIQQALKNPQKTAQYLPLNDMPLRKIGALPSFQEMIDLFHQENGIDVASIEVPALVVTGWYDMATPETAEIYRVLRNRKSGKGLNDEVNYLAGPWDHNTTASAVGEKFFSPFANF